MSSGYSIWYHGSRIRSDICRRALQNFVAINNSVRIRLSGNNVLANFLQFTSLHLLFKNWGLHFLNNKKWSAHFYEEKMESYELGNIFKIPGNF